MKNGKKYNAMNIVNAEAKRKSVGKIIATASHLEESDLSTVNSLGLAHMRLSYVPLETDAAQSNKSLQLEDNSLDQILISRPRWWPTSWGREEM